MTQAKRSPSLPGQGSTLDKNGEQRTVPFLIVASCGPRLFSVLPPERPHGLYVQTEPRPAFAIQGGAQLSRDHRAGTEAGAS
jgi:hypothetical protein